MNQRKYENHIKNAQHQQIDTQNPKRRWSKQDTPRNYENIKQLNYSVDYSLYNNKYLTQIRNNTRIKQLILKQKIETFNFHQFKLQHDSISKTKLQVCSDNIYSMINQQKKFAYLEFQMH